jgi:hypothetical protein
MHGGEPKGHEFSAQNDNLEGFFRSLQKPALQVEFGHHGNAREVAVFACLGYIKG